MCVSLQLRVTKVMGATAKMHDGRLVRLGPLTSIAPGDYLEVYADLAIGKVEIDTVKKIHKERNI